ncbi:MAG: rSAM/selenodomain-associated transferase 1 [Paracoccaceae bacterium]|jgi:rSAM/selenodomain-associated transferase 1
MRQLLVVMVKEPHPGRVKTRLGRDIGMVPAAWWFRHQSARLLRRLRDPRWQVVLAVSPDREGLASRVWPADLVRLPQGRGDLGARMRRGLRCNAQGNTRGPVCVIGADIPCVTRAHIARAFAALGAHDLVFGPALDGGYWLVGARHGGRVPAGLFQNVRWSGPHALADSVASAQGARVALVDRLRDVDDAADLRAAPPP